MKSFILASQSPRRIELIKIFIPDIAVMPDDSAETIKDNESPAETVKRLSLQKAENTSRKAGKDAIVIAADTVVAIDDMILGKPKNKDEAYRMLKRLSGKLHTVYTGVAIIDTKTNKKVSDYEKTNVKFCNLSDARIYEYINTAEPMDKAGAYGIQGFGALLISGIDGDYFNVMGLPLCKLGRIMYNDFGIDLMNIERGE